MLTAPDSQMTRRANGTGAHKSGTNGSSANGTKPPFGYYGAKQRLAAQIIATLPPNNAWVEAFCGSAAITLERSLRLSRSSMTVMAT
jgi:hypothetical protein